jgi:hypothetical protein
MEEKQELEDFDIEVKVSVNVKAKTREEALLIALDYVGVCEGADTDIINFGCCYE